MATDWAPVVQTSIGAVAAIGGGFVGAWWQSKSQHRIDHDRKRERAAELAGTALQLADQDARIGQLSRLGTDDLLAIRGQLTPDRPVGLPSVRTAVEGPPPSGSPLL